MARRLKPGNQLNDLDCPFYATCEKVNRICSHDIPACMAIKLSEEVCRACREEHRKVAGNEQ